MIAGAAGLEQAEALLAARHLSRAADAFTAAEAAGADPERVSAGRWMLAMLGGDFEAAWRESDSTRARETPDPHRFWNGEALRGKRVIVRSLHGLGDAVQMLCYAPTLRALAARVVWEVAPHLVELARCARGVDAALSWDDLAPPWEVQIEAMELPYLFRTTLADLPIATRYLTLPPERLLAAKHALGIKTRPRVGLLWSGGAWNRARAIPFALLAPLLADTGIEFWSLQHAPDDPTHCGGKLPHATLCCGGGVMGLAAAIAELDLVITVDTLAGHLAGALGRPVWIMLRAEGDWRWMTARNDSPWYPTVRLFRQATEGDWPPVVEQVRTALAQTLGGLA